MNGGNFLQNYEQVDDRLKRFFTDYKDSRIHVHTELVDTPPTLKGIIFKATIQVFDLDNNLVFSANGWANEVPGDGMVNKDSVVENCETSAVGRALANLSYSGSKRPSKEEMNKVGRGAYQDPKPSTASTSVASSTTNSTSQGNGSTSNAFKPTFGKYAGRTLESISSDEMESYISFLSKDPSKMSTAANDFVKFAKIELEKRKKNGQDSLPF